MKIFDENFTLYQERLMKWATPIIQDEFPCMDYVSGVDYVGANGITLHGIKFSGIDTTGDSVIERLYDFCSKLNKSYQVILAEPDAAYVGGEEAIDVEITIKGVDFWNSTFKEDTFHFIRRMACKDIEEMKHAYMPKDGLLHNRLENPFCCINPDNTEDGFGIEGTVGDHKIDFTVVAVEYTETYVYPDTLETLPDVWMYSGSWDGHHIEGLASSSTFAVGKMLQAIYKDAKKHDPEVASMVKHNLFRFRSYGFCGF